jgi:cyclohexa-1,5-dienecarbonyl-CoA hydratase
MMLVSDAAFTFDTDEKVARLTLHRSPLNILTLEVTQKLNEALRNLSGTGQMNALVVCATGKAFCAGVDVADHLPERAQAMIHSFNELCHQLRALPMPTIAIVQGMALGGGMELAIACDMILAGKAARFGLPEIKLGVFPPVAAALLPSLIGYRQAARLLFTGETINAEEAARLGLVTFVVEDTELEAAQGRLLAQLLNLSAAALMKTKESLRIGAWRGEQALAEIEDLYLHKLMVMTDAREGIQAFMEKRSPVWRDA